MQTDVNATRIGIYWRRFNRPQRKSGKRWESENALSKYTSINFGENPLEVYNGILLHVNCGHVQPVYVELQQHVSRLYASICTCRHVYQDMPVQDHCCVCYHCNALCASAFATWFVWYCFTNLRICSVLIMNRRACFTHMGVLTWCDAMRALSSYKSMCDCVYAHVCCECVCRGCACVNACIYSHLTCVSKFFCARVFPCYAAASVCWTYGI